MSRNDESVRLRSKVLLQLEQASRDNNARSTKGEEAAKKAAKSDLSIWQAAIRKATTNNDLFNVTAFDNAEIRMLTFGLFGRAVRTKYDLPGLRGVKRNHGEEFWSKYADELEYLLGSPFTAKCESNQRTKF